MGTISENAMTYEAPATRNISELSEVKTSLEVKEEVGMNKDGQEFKVKFVMVNGEKYRVPVSVLRDLKSILEEKPALTKFKVKKAGSGMSTSYTVIPIN